MAERRMFTNKITEADAFTALPPTTQCLYFHLCMNADDDGFSNKIRQSMFNAHADQNDFQLLVDKRFIIPFESGVVVIKHWRMHNLIRSDRYHQTDYINERATLVLKKNGAYTDNLNCDNQVTTKCLPNDNQMEPEVRLGKERIGKVKESAPETTEDPLETSSLSDKSKAALRDWIAYKKERRESYKPMGLKALITKMENLEKTVGSNGVVDAINNSMACGYKGIFPAKSKNGDSQPKKGFNNFDGRNYGDSEMDALEQALLAKRR